MLQLHVHTKCAKHREGKVRLERKEKCERDIAATMKAHDNEVHPKGETLPMEERVYRVKCVCTFLKVGVPLSKIETFRELLEENAYRLGSRKVMCDLIPLILRDEQEKTKKEIGGQPLSVIFDSTSRMGEALTIP